MTVRLVETLAKRGCLTISEDQTIEALARFLTEHKIGAVPVIDKDGELAGIVSERDVVRHMAAAEANYLQQPVASIMTKQVVTCQITDSASDMMAAMTNKKIRHIPIIDDEKQLIGIVSIGDVVSRMIEKYQAETEMMRFYINS